MNGTVDWRTIRLKPGDWSCPTHGVIDPARDRLVPYCRGDVGGRTCMRIAWLCEVPSRHVQPRPAACRHGHPFGPNTFLTGWRGCQCTPAGGHTWWVCLSDGCGDEQEFPPHNPQVKRPC